MSEATDGVPTSTNGPSEATKEARPEANEPSEAAVADLAQNSRLRPWLPRPGEGAQAHAAAMCYFELREQRSITEVARKCHKNRSLIARWSEQWGWVERARAYDLRLARVEHRAREKALAGSVEECEKRRAELREREWKAAATLHRLAEQILTEQEKYKHEDYKLGDAAMLLNRASVLGRGATNLADRAAIGRPSRSDTSDSDGKGK